MIAERKIRKGRRLSETRQIITHAQGPFRYFLVVGDDVAAGHPRHPGPRASRRHGCILLAGNAPQQPMHAIVVCGTKLPKPLRPAGIHIQSSQ
jgi:hypothetical protein